MASETLPGTPPQTTSSQRQALVVDDSRSARYAMRKYLEKYHYEVATVENGADALGYLRLHRPLVVFLDHLMPGITGLEVLKALKNDPSTVAIPVVICTSVERPEFHHEARISGAMEVMQKPPSLARLADLLHGLERMAVPVPVILVPPPEAAQGTELVTVAPAGTPASVPPSVERYAELYAEINSHLRRLTEDIFVQLSELKAQLARLDSDGLSPQETQALRQIAREEADSLQEAVRKEIDEVRRRIDVMDLFQRRDREELLQAARLTAQSAAHTAAESAVTDVMTRLSNKLTDSLLKALGKQ